MNKMKTLHDVDELMMKYMERHNMKYKKMICVDGQITAETFCFTTLEAKLTATGKITFKVDGKRTSIHK
jgi:hypothetical protein